MEVKVGHVSRVLTESLSSVEPPFLRASHSAGTSPAFAAAITGPSGAGAWLYSRLTAMGRVGASLLLSSLCGCGSGTGGKGGGAAGSGAGSCASQARVRCISSGNVGRARGSTTRAA